MSVTIWLLWSTFRNSLPDLLSKRYAKPLDRFYLRREFYEADAGILLVVRQKGDEFLVEEAQEPTPEGVKLNSQIRYILAHYEVLFHEVEEGRIEEEHIKRTMSGRVKKHHHLLMPYIEHTRDGIGPSNYLDIFEKYAKKWNEESMQE